MQVSYDEPLDRAVVQSCTRIEGQPQLPPDKSIAHRSAIFAALGDGTSRILNYPASADPQSTLACLRQLGIEMEARDDAMVVHGRGLRGLQPAGSTIDCGNSGTTMRLLTGVLAGQAFDSTIEGDASLNARPMERIALPLREMGADVRLSSGHAPIRIQGAKQLHGINYRLPVASAQVKSCILLAGLYADGRTTIIERKPSRDHTERMLGLTSLKIGDERHVVVEEGTRIPARVWPVPRDFSAAAFFMVAAAIAPSGEVRMERVGLNPTRSALLDVLRAMGAGIWVTNESDDGGEPVGDVTVRPSMLHGVQVEGDLIPVLIDEIPVLAVAAAAAEGRTEIRDARELRVKETDRIRATVENLRALGAKVQEFDDGFAVEGGSRLTGTGVRSFGDHRMAMAMAVAGLLADGETTIEGASCAAVSFPDFWEELSRVVS